MHCTLFSWVTAYVAVKISISQVNAACSVRPKVPVSLPGNPDTTGKMTGLGNFQNPPPESLAGVLNSFSKAWLDFKQFLF